MELYNWQTILEKKTDKELVDIFKGNSFLTYEGEIFAGLELKKRNYNPTEIEEIRKIKMSQLNNEMTELNFLTFRKSKFYKRLIYKLLLVVFSIWLISKFQKDFIAFLPYYAIYVIVAFASSIFISILFYKKYKTTTDKNIKIKNELLSKLEQS